ncbi:MAG: sigma-70 family RNA polymerase sigma factor [Chloroflexi bacterium]|nr:sigma-70 family RNA polymerase sigma factor [Chloroflexota bacterium]
MAVVEVSMIERAQQGDSLAFESIFSAYQGPIYNYILRIMGSQEDARDLTQDTFLKAYRALPKTSPDLNLSAWLYRIATNTCRDEFRRRKIIKWQPWDMLTETFFSKQVAPDNPERETIHQEIKEAVQLVLNKLPYKYKLCLVLREYEGLSCEQIAEILGTSRSAVKSLLFRAREQFRSVYNTLEDGPKSLLRQEGEIL